MNLKIGRRIIYKDSVRGGIGTGKSFYGIIVDKNRERDTYVIEVWKKGSNVRYCLADEVAGHDIEMDKEYYLGLMKQNAENYKNGIAKI